LDGAMEKSQEATLPIY